MPKNLEDPSHANIVKPPSNPLKLIPGVPFSMMFRLLWVSRICQQRTRLFCREKFDLEPNLILILLAAGECHLHQGTLAKSLGIGQNAMVFQVDKLEVRGFIKRIPNPDNRRARLIECTSKGRAVVAEIKANYTEIVRWVLHPLDGAQIEQFGILLAQIIEGETSLKSPVPLVRWKKHSPPNS